MYEGHQKLPSISQLGIKQSVEFHHADCEYIIPKFGKFRKNGVLLSNKYLDMTKNMLNVTVTPINFKSDNF